MSSAELEVCVNAEIGRCYIGRREREGRRGEGREGGERGDGGGEDRGDKEEERGI
jgi:hypothetical protein